MAQFVTNRCHTPILVFGSLSQLVEATREYGPGCYVVEKIPAEGESPRGGHAERRWGAIVHRVDAGHRLRLVLASTDAAYKNAYAVQPVTVHASPTEPATLSVPTVG